MIDVRDDKLKFQSMDVDFLWERINRCVYFVEVKTDRVAHRTGNIPYELTSRGKQGCFARTKADFVFFYIQEAHRMLCIDVKLLRKHIAMSDYEESDMGERGTGYLIPIDRIRKLADAETKRKIIPKEWEV